MFGHNFKVYHETVGENMIFLSSPCSLDPIVRGHWWLAAQLWPKAALTGVGGVNW
jgi:hypothetical protein